MGEYNGWRNRQTWNVALWVGNDPGLYAMADEYANRGGRITWRGFVKWAGLDGERTPDGVAYDGTRLDCAALSDVLREMRDEAAA